MLTVGKRRGLGGDQEMACGRRRTETAVTGKTPAMKPPPI
jgi:hypothetical protein